MPNFPANPSDQDPYPRFNFQIRWEGEYVPGIFHVGPIGWVAARSDDGSSGLLTSLGSFLTGGVFGGDDPAVRYSPVQLQRGRTQDTFFESWARSASDPDADSSTDLVRTIEIQLLDETRRPVIAFILRGCTPIEYVALGPLDANADGIAVETLTLVYRSFERDPKAV